MIKSNLFKKSCVAVSLSSYLVSSTFAAIPTMTVEYDAAGNVAKQTAGNGQAHNYGYDIAGNVVSYSSPGVGSTSFEYGPESLSKFTDFKGLNTTYQIDKLTGQVESVTSPDTGTTSFTYDQAGNVVSALTPAGVTFSFTYDALNRPLSASFGDETVNYSYYSYGAAKGELASIQDSTGSTGFNYNAQGLHLSKTQTTTGAGGGAGASLGYLKTWSAGQLSSLRYPSGKTISYTYDAERITSISLNGAVIVSNITYSANGAPVSWQMGSTGTYSRSYDSYGRMVSYSIDGTAKAVGWDENNRVSSIDYAAGTSSFGYDAADRLTSASGGPHAGAGYAYDANGNKTSVTVAGANYGATVDPNSNKILTFTAPGVARSYSYDNKGNTIGDGTRTYSWSNTNKLLSATNGSTTAYYGYNGFGQRVKKVVGQASRYYFYDDDGYSLLGEYFQTTPGSPVGTVYETVYLEGIPVAVLKGSSVYYIQPDHLNTPRVIRDSAGVLVWKWDSDLYGKGLANQNPGGVSLFEFNIRFPGQVFDTETGLHYNMARYYDPELGRYTSSDPIGLGGGVNTYEYVAGNPTGAVDPTGLIVPVVAVAVLVRIAAPIVLRQVAFRASTWTLSHMYELNAIGIGIAEAYGGVSISTPLAASVGPAVKNFAKAGSEVCAIAEHAGAAKKGLTGIGVTINGGLTFGKSPYMYPVKPGQSNYVQIELTGSRAKDFKLANELSNLQGEISKNKPAPSGYTWHHIDDYNSATGTASMELVLSTVHEAIGHSGGASQYEKAKKVKYK